MAATDAKEQRRDANEYGHGFSESRNFMNVGVIPSLLYMRYTELETEKGREEFYRDCPVFRTRDVGGLGNRITVPRDIK